MQKKGTGVMDFFAQSAIFGQKENKIKNTSKIGK